MSQEVTLLLHRSDLDCEMHLTVYVEKVVMTDSHVRLEGLDPSHYLEAFREELTFFSKNLTALVEPDMDVTVESVSPSTTPVPDNPIRT